MATKDKPDVRVRLSAEGVKEVTDALRKIADDAIKQGRRSESAFSPLIKSLGGIRGIVSKLATVFGGRELARLGKDALDYADAIGKSAQRTGATAEELSVLQIAASTADVEVTDLEKSLVRLAANMELLRQGTQTQKDAFAALGLQYEDLKDKTTGEAFVEIAQRLGKIEDGAKKTAIAYGIFGKAGADLLPLLNDLSDNGFDAVREKAEQMGLVVSTETALLAANVNDSFTDMQTQVKGLAVQFVSGLLPSVKQVMDDFKKDVDGKGTGTMRKFGAETGRIVRIVIQIFKLFETVVSGALRVVGQSLGAIVAAAVQAFKGNFSEAGTILKEAFVDGVDVFKAKFKEATGELKNLVDEALSEPREVEIKPVVRKGAAIETETQEERALRTKREAEAKRAAEEAKRKAAQLARERQQAADKLYDTETELLAAEGNRAAAFERNLAKELAGIQKLMDTLQIGHEEQEAFLKRVETSQRGAFNLEGLKEQFDAQLKAFDEARDRINQRVQAGLITQFQAELQIRDLEASRIPILEDINTQLQAQATALGTDSVASVHDYQLAVEQLKIAHDSATLSAETFKTTLFDSFDSGLAGALKGLREFTSVGSAVKSVLDSILQSFINLTAEIVAKQATLALLNSVGGGGGGFLGIGGFAEGGQVGGRGTGTSDSNLALLSKGEFVVRERAVRQPGILGLLKAINGGMGRSIARAGAYPRFADGGLVDTSRARNGTNLPPMNFYLQPDKNGRISKVTTAQIGIEVSRAINKASARNS